MATKKISGKGLAADVRAGMDCVALTEKHGLSVTELKKALAAIGTRGVLSQDELPAWLAEEWLPVEATAGAIVNPLAPNYSLYFSGEFFTNPREFKSLEELRRHLYKNCMEAQQMADSFRSLEQNRPESKEEGLQAYRARGQLDQRARDCKEHFERIQEVLSNRAEMIVPWVTHWGQ